MSLIKSILYIPFTDGSNWANVFFFLDQLVGVAVLQREHLNFKVLVHFSRDFESDNKKRKSFESVGK